MKKKIKSERPFLPPINCLNPILIYSIFKRITTQKSTLRSQFDEKIEYKKLRKQAKKTVLKKCVGTKDVRDEKDGKLGVGGARDIGHVAPETTEQFNMTSKVAWVQASGSVMPFKVSLNPLPFLCSFHQHD
jgi:hypothetical protein